MQNPTECGQMPANTATCYLSRSPQTSSVGPGRQHAVKPASPVLRIILRIFLIHRWRRRSKEGGNSSNVLCGSLVGPILAKASFLH